MARTYHRDSRGRFASGGGGGSGGRKAAPVKLTRRTPVSQGGGRSRGHLVKRAAVAAAKGKLAAKDPADQSIKGTLSRRSQKGAVTRAEKALAAAKQGGRVRLSGRSGVLRVGRRATKAKASRDYLSKNDIAQKQARLTVRSKGTKTKKAKSLFIRDAAATVYRAQERLRYTGRLTDAVIRKGVPYPERLRTRRR